MLVEKQWERMRGEEEKRMSEWRRCVRGTAATAADAAAVGATREM